MNFERRRGPAQLRRRASSRQSHFLHSSADIFVGTGFRFWLTGLRTGDLSHWERAFALSANVLGIETARDVCRDFSQWVRVISERSRRDLKTLDPDNPCFCRDECVAMAVVAAYQHKGCPALQACALTLLECDPHGDIGALSGSLADRLKAADHVLSHHAIGHVVRYAGGPTRLVS
jgi:hypothetical protein